MNKITLIAAAAMLMVGTSAWADPDPAGKAGWSEAFANAVGQNTCTNKGKGNGGEFYNMWTGGCLKQPTATEGKWPDMNPVSPGQTKKD